MANLSDLQTNDVELTQILIIKEIEKSKKFCGKILGVTVPREYGGTPCEVKFLQINS